MNCAARALARGSIPLMGTFTTSRSYAFFERHSPQGEV